MSMAPQAAPKLACLVCRQRKVACDRQRPRCGLCTKNDFDCQYKSRQHRPGLRAGYVSQLEQQLENVQERLKRVETHLQQHSPFMPAPLYAFGNEHLEGDDSVLNSEEAEGSLMTSCVGEEPAATVPDEAMDWQGMVAQDADLYSVANRSLKTWFQLYHTWCPIINQGSLRDISDNTPSRYALVWKALTAVVIFDQDDATPAERAMAGQLRDQVMLRAVETSSLQSLQALLILSNSVYAKGNFAEFWNILGMCKRMLLNPQIQASFTEPRYAYASRAAAATHRAAIDNIEAEEATRAFWMVEMLDGMSTMGLPNHSHLKLRLTANLPCLESLWSSPGILLDQPASHSPKPQYSSGFSLCIMLVVEELKVVGEFLDKPYDLKDLHQRLAWQSEAQRIDERLTNWREEFVATVFQLINYEKEQLPRGEMEPFFTLTNCVLNTAIITLLQQMAPLPKEMETDFEPWAYATTRCVYACENLTAKVRRIRADQLRAESPFLIMPIFVAARFYVTYSKALDADVPANLHTLAFTLHTCGQKWPMARKYETIIRTAVAEHRSPINQCVLPVEFYDFRYSTLEIIDLLQNAAGSLESP